MSSWIYVTNLPIWMDESEITKEFSEIGGIKRIHVTPNKILLKSVSFVQFGQPKLAHTAACKKDGVVIGGCAIRVYVVWTPKENLSTVRVTNISEEIDNEELIALFSPFGDIVDARVHYDQKDAMVSFTRIDYALQAAQEMDGAIIGDYGNIKVELANPDARNLKWKRARFEYISCELPSKSPSPSPSLSQSSSNFHSFNMQSFESGSNNFLMPPTVGTIRTPSPSLSATSTTITSQHSIASLTQPIHPIQNQFEIRAPSNLYPLSFSTHPAQSQDSIPRPNYVTTPVTTVSTSTEYSSQLRLPAQPLSHKIGYNTSNIPYSAIAMPVNDNNNIYLKNQNNGINNVIWNLKGLSTGIPQTVANTNYFIEDFKNTGCQSSQSSDYCTNMSLNFNLPSIAAVPTPMTHSSNQSFVECNYDQFSTNSLSLEKMELESKHISISNINNDSKLPVWTPQQRELGDQVYHKIEKDFPERVAKITGVILQLNFSQINELLANHNLLLKKAEQINKVLEETVVQVKNL